jgi:hypothetical protein
VPGRLLAYLPAHTRTCVGLSDIGAKVFVLILEGLYNAHTTRVRSDDGGARSLIACLEDCWRSTHHTHHTCLQCRSRDIEMRVFVLRLPGKAAGVAHTHTRVWVSDIEIGIFVLAYWKSCWHACLLPHTHTHAVLESVTMRPDLCPHYLEGCFGVPFYARTRRPGLGDVGPGIFVLACLGCCWRARTHAHAHACAVGDDWGRSSSRYTEELLACAHYTHTHTRGQDR